MARAWIQGKAWAGKGENRDEARGKLIKYLKVICDDIAMMIKYLKVVSNDVSTSTRWSLMILQVPQCGLHYYCKYLKVVC